MSYLRAKGSQVALVVKNAPANAEDMRHGFDPFVRKIPDPLQKGVVAYSSIPAWRIPWAEETGG